MTPTEAIQRQTDGQGITIVILTMWLYILSVRVWLQNKKK